MCHFEKNLNRDNSGQTQLNEIISGLNNVLREWVVTIVIITKYNDRMTLPIRGNDNSFQSEQYLNERSLFFRKIDKSFRYVKD